MNDKLIAKLETFINNEWPHAHGQIQEIHDKVDSNTTDIGWLKAISLGILLAIVSTMLTVIGTLIVTILNK